MGFVLLIDYLVPFGFSHHKNWSLAVVGPAGNKQKICWHSSVVKFVWARDDTRAHVRVHLMKAALGRMHVSLQHIVFSVCSREIMRGGGLSLMCKFSINNSRLVSPKRPSWREAMFTAPASTFLSPVSIPYQDHYLCSTEMKYSHFQCPSSYSLCWWP